jgi:hypothetical protein
MLCGFRPTYDKRRRIPALITGGRPDFLHEKSHNKGHTEKHGDQRHIEAKRPDKRHSHRALLKRRYFLNAAAENFASDGFNACRRDFHCKVRMNTSVNSGHQIFQASACT